MTEEAAPAEKPEKKSRKPLLRAGLLMAIVALIGVGLGSLGGSDEDPATAENQNTENPQPPEPPPAEPGALLDEARRYLYAGNVGEAYKLFLRFTSDTAEAPDDLIQYELAVAAEGVGDALSAQRLYEGLVASGRTPTLRAGAALGQARLRFRAREHAAVDQLLARGLNSGALTVTETVRAEAEYLRAIALARLAQEHRPQSLLHDRGLVQGRLGWSVDRVLGLLDDKQQKPLPDSVPRSLEAEGRGPNAIITAALPRSTVFEITNELAGSCTLQTRWSTAATRVAKGRFAALYLENLALSSVLDRVLFEHGLVWTQQDSVIRISSHRQLPAEDLRALHKEMANRALWDAITAFPDDLRASLAMLSLGNLDADTDPLSADARYDELIRHRRPDVRMHGYFNRGKLALAISEMADASENFLAAAEYGRGTLIESVSLLFAGRIQLELGRSDEAIDHLQRAVGYLDSRELRGEILSDSEHDDALAVAAQTLAAAWLMDGSPLAANRGLLRHRRLLENEPYRDATAFLAALGSFRAATTKDKQLREGQSLIAALSHVKPALMFSEAGTLLVGEAWQELGLGAQMAILFEADGLAVQSPWLKKRMLMHVLRYQRVIGDDTAVARVLTELSALPTESDFEVQIATAEHALRQGRIDEAISRCRTIIDLESADEAAVLELMGRAFERAGDHRSAATCYGGLLPPVPQSTGEAQLK